MLHDDWNEYFKCEQGKEDRQDEASCGDETCPYCTREYDESEGYQYKTVVDIYNEGIVG